MMADSRYGTDKVIVALGFPGGDSAVKDRAVQGKVQLHVVVDCIVVPVGNAMGEGVSMSRRRFRARAIGPVLGNAFLFVGQVSADVAYFINLRHVSLIIGHRLTQRIRIAASIASFHRTTTLGPL